MRRLALSHHLRPVVGALGALALLLALVPWPPAPPALAQVNAGASFGSAVPCLLAESVFATTCVADTISSPVPASDPALVEFGAAGKGAMRAPLGARFNENADSIMLDGIGSTYGLAYDDGAVSGRRRLLAAAYTKRLVSFGMGGPGGIYEYSYSSGQWRIATIVPGAWNDGPARKPSDYRDRAIIGQVGKTGLGDMEIAPDGRTLYVTNLGSRRIERFDISAGPLAYQGPLGIPFGLISADPAVQADLRPFALEFHPRIFSAGPALVVGVTDTAQRGGGAAPAIYLLTYFTGSDTWGLSLAQSLMAPPLAARFAHSTYPDVWSAETGAAWNRWIDNIDSAPTRISLVPGGADGVDEDIVVAMLLYPQPLLSDIEFNRDGSTMFLGLRDRSGDQTYFKLAPHPEKVSIAQGDTLTYRLAGGAWQLQTVSRIDPANENDPADTIPAAASDYFNDSLHAYGMDAEMPPHPENHLGALATSLRGDAGGFAEQVMISSLLGNSRSGFSLYSEAGGQRASYTQLIGSGDAAGGKSAALGDVELLCTYAFVGGRVWQDSNNNGVQDAGEPPFANITLELFKGGDASAPALARATTGADGRYLFAVEPNTAFNLRIAAASFQPLGPAAGWYFVRANSGGNDTIDSDAHEAYGYIEFFGAGVAGTGVTGAPAAVRPRESDERSFDIGLTRVAPTGQIGDRVWDDTNRNGLQDAGEPGLGGALVTLERDSSTSAAPASGTYPTSTTTHANGTYSFIGLEPGRYRVRFTPLAGYSATRANVGANEAIDSDADAAGGYATGWALLAGDDLATAAREGRILTLDFGLLNLGADVAVDKDGPAQALVDQTIGYTLAYRNTGPAPASEVRLVDTLPAGAAYLSASPPPASVAGRTLTWNLGALAPGQQGAIAVQVRAPATLSPPGATSQSLTNQAAIITSSPDPDPDNNSSAVTTLLARPEVLIAKSAPAAALVGDEIAYMLSYQNAGSIAAANVVIDDALPAGLSFSRFSVNPGGACGYNVVSRLVRCAFASLEPGAEGVVQLAARVEVGAPASLSNTATIATSTAGDDPANNSSTSVTAVQRPNPGVAISVSPSPFPVGTSGTITARYGNGLTAAASGPARGTTLTVTLSAGGLTLGTLPAGCAYTAASRTITCALGDLAAGATGARAFPIALPANFGQDSLSATASIASATPERAADQADNTAAATTPVVRPNVFVDAAGPGSIVGQGSAFWYTLDYGNIYRRSPSLTRAAQGVVLRATLPPDVTFVSASSAPATSAGGQLTWNLGALAPQQSGRIYVVVQTAVPAGAALGLLAEISTATPGDDPADNRDLVVTEVVQPPAALPPSQGDLRLAIHSELDPNSQDGDPANGVYLSQGSRIAWPAGEVLDFTPRLSGLRFDGEPLPFPYEYRARVTGWSVAAFAVNGVSREPSAPDSRGVAGCRNGRRPSGSTLSGCVYDYLGGADLAAIRAGSTPRESELAGQAHVYWTQPPAPPMRPDVYLYAVDPLAPARLGLQVEVEVWIVNAYPGEIDGIPLPEIPVAPLPDPERRLVGGTFEVTLLVPRSLVGPGSLAR